MSDEPQRRAGEIRTVYIQHLLHCGVSAGYLNRQESLFKTVCTLLNSNTARLHADGGAGQAAFYSQRWRYDRDGARYIRARRAEARGRVVQEPFRKKKRKKKRALVSLQKYWNACYRKLLTPFAPISSSKPTKSSTMKRDVSCSMPGSKRDAIRFLFWATWVNFRTACIHVYATNKCNNK